MKSTAPATESLARQFRKDLLDEQLLTLDQVGEICAPPGHAACRQNVYRWINAGLAVAPGKRAKLKKTKLPSGSFVKGSDLRAFLRELQGAEAGTAGMVGRRSKPEQALLHPVSKFLVGSAT